jgi:hypothetical protein
VSPRAGILCDCKRIGPAQGIRGRDEREVVPIDWVVSGQGEPWARRLQMRDAGTTGGNALPNRDPPDVTRFKAPMRHDVGRLFDEFAVAPDAVTRQVGANVKIDPKGRDFRIADLGDADDRARLRIELAEAMKRGHRHRCITLLGRPKRAPVGLVPRPVHLLLRSLPKENCPRSEVPRTSVCGRVSNLARVFDGGVETQHGSFGDADLVARHDASQQRARR